MKRLFLISIFIFASFILFKDITFAFTESSTGFIDGGIWYSQIPKVEGENVEVHTAVWNGTNKEIKVHVEFSDGNTLLGSRDVNVPINFLADIHIPWKVTPGEHNLSAKITKSTSTVGDTLSIIPISNSSVESEKITILKKSAVDSGAMTPVDTIAKKVVSNLPSSVANPVSNLATKVEDFRIETQKDIDKNLASTKNNIAELEKSANQNSKSVTTKTQKQSSSLSGTEKPIAYIELFFLTVASYILTEKVLFYSIGIILSFFILRTIFNLVKRRRWQAR